MTTTFPTRRAPDWMARHPVACGFALMFVCTWPVDLWAAASSHGWAPPIPAVLPLLVGYGFVVAAVAMTWLLDGRGGVGVLLRRFLVWRVGLFWYAVVLLGPAVVDLAAIGLDALLAGRAPDFGQTFGHRLVGSSMALWVAIPLFLVFGALTNGEEIGWRGYALPRLLERPGIWEQHRALVASVVVGVVWALWHVPKFLTAGSAEDYPFWIFVLAMVAKSIVYTWVFVGTRGSLLTVTLLHAAWNTADVFLPLLPAATGDSRALVIAVGLQCLVAVVLVVVTGPARLSRTAP
jgi:membrane protease YdiL (CAAX protease family)